MKISSSNIRNYYDCHKSVWVFDFWFDLVGLTVLAGCTWGF